MPLGVLSMCTTHPLTPERLGPLLISHYPEALHVLDSCFYAYGENEGLETAAA